MKSKLARAGAALVLALSACPGCGGSQEPQWPAPTQRPPESYVPSDLDVVLRVDLARIRSSLPPGAWDALLAWTGSRPQGPRTSLVTSALGKANQVWIGMRLGARGTAADTVMVMEGDFSEVSQEERLRAFSPGRDRGAGLVVFDAPAPRSVNGTVSTLHRSEFARLYSWNEELWIVASAAEVDAVERSVELGMRVESGLVPPARGVASVALRMAPVVSAWRATAPRAAALAEKAEVLEASADLRSDGLDARVEIVFSATEPALRAQRALNVLLTELARSEGFDLQGLRMEVVQKTLVVEATASLATLAALVE